MRAVCFIRKFQLLLNCNNYENLNPKSRTSQTRKTLCASLNMTKMRNKITVFLLLFSLATFGQDTIKKHNISGTIKYRINGEFVIPDETFITLYPNNLFIESDSSDNFKSEKLRPGTYTLEIDNYTSNHQKYVITITDKSISDYEIIIDVKCDIDNLTALADIKDRHPKLMLISGIAPVHIKGQENFEKKYKVKYHEFGCIAPIKTCVLMYNKVIFEYLDKKFGKKWRNDVRADVLGLK